MSARPFHHQRPLAVAAAAYGIGVWAGVSFSWEPLWYAAGLAFSLLAAWLLGVLGRRRIAGFLLAMLFVGALAGGRAAHPALPDSGRYRVTGVLASDAQLREDGTAAAYLKDVHLDGEAGETAVHAAYWTYTLDPDAPFLPREGDRVVFEGKVYHPQGRVNPYGFDFRMYLLQKGVSIGVSGAAGAETAGHPGRGLRSFFYHARESLLHRTRMIFGSDSPLPEALLLGWRGDLPQETQQGFADAGVAHLLAVSGLHVGLLAAVLLIPLSRWLSPKGRLAALGLFLLSYCALLDFPAPVVRASLLLLLGLYRRTVRRAGDALTSLCVAFLLILLLRPLDLFSASFQLSFCAVLGFVLLRPPLETLLSRVRPGFLREGWITTLSATAGAALPTVQIFHRLSLTGLLINPLLCAFFGVLLPLYALTLAVGCAYLPAGVWLAEWVSSVSRGVVRAVEWVGDLPFSTVRVPALPWYCVSALAVCCVLLSRYWLGSPKKKAMAALALAAVSLGAWRLTLCRDVQYMQLAMGQADAALILDGRETLLIDAGDYGGDIADYLLSTGRKADRVILTHLHTDHCMGLKQLLEEQVPIGAVYIPEGAEETAVDGQCLELIDDLRSRGIPVKSLRAGDEIALPRARVTVLWPIGDTVRAGADANRYCLAALCDLDGVKLLACADLIGDYEMYAARDADILKVAHHGSKSSTGERFIEAVSPKAALITGKPFDAPLPHPDTLERLKDAGVDVWNTGACGAVTVTVRGGQAEMTAYLSKEERE